MTYSWQTFIGYLFPSSPDLIASATFITATWLQIGFFGIMPSPTTFLKSELATFLLILKVFTGHTDQVSRKMGFSALPMACLVSVFSTKMFLFYIF